MAGNATGYHARLVCLFVCLFVLTTPGMPVVALLPRTEATFLGRDPEYTRVTAEETRCRIATSPLVDHPSNRRPAHSLLGEVPLVTTLKCWFARAFSRPCARCRSRGLSSASVTSVGVVLWRRLLRLCCAKPTSPNALKRS